MESEKVKEIKKALEICQKNNCIDCPYLIDEKSCRANDLLLDTLTLINELESENERYKQSCGAIGQNSLTIIDQLKDRIAKLEKENAKLKSTNTNILKSCDEYKNRHLNQFGERLKEKLGSVDLIRGWTVKVFIDETLKEFIK